jgi:hypothetical protein
MEGGKGEEKKAGLILIFDANPKYLGIIVKLTCIQSGGNVDGQN